MQSCTWAGFHRLELPNGPPISPPGGLGKDVGECVARSTKAPVNSVCDLVPFTETAERLLSAGRCRSCPIGDSIARVQRCDMIEGALACENCAVADPVLLVDATGTADHTDTDCAHLSRSAPSRILSCCCVSSHGAQSHAGNWTHETQARCSANSSGCANYCTVFMGTDDRPRLGAILKCRRRALGTDFRCDCRCAPDLHGAREWRQGRPARQQDRRRCPHCQQHAVDVLLKGHDCHIAAAIEAVQVCGARQHLHCVLPEGPSVGVSSRARYGRLTEPGSCLPVDFSSSGATAHPVELHGLVLNV
mmetsp:Transcript_80881/g.187803  ORF Transcript_80881/g.187803 Transcript_80881/m.187803 type:complete len:305 (+) Transcript_80881:61-975(+)